MSINESSLASAMGALRMPGTGSETVLPQDVLARLTRQHPNILLVGPAAFIHAALKTIEPLVPQPIVSWRPYETHGVPDAACSTLVIHRVDTANVEQQQELFGWFETKARQVQVVATTLAPLYPRVTEGAFLEALYYRLNHVCLMSDRLHA
jgi:hypothetical protein